jgi:hypothetical protein
MSDVIASAMLQPASLDEREDYNDQCGLLLQGLEQIASTACSRRHGSQKTRIQGCIKKMENETSEALKYTEKLETAM